MNVKILKWNDPKEKKTALNQAAVVLEMIKNSGQKEMNCLQQIEALQKKLEKLQEKIQKLNDSKEFWEQNTEQAKKRLEFLRQEFSLTEAEILEAHSRLLRQRLSSLQAQLDNQTTVTGFTTKES